MRGVVFHGRNDIRYEPSHPEPEISHPTDVKIKVHYCGICGSDLHEYLDGPIFFASASNPISGRNYVQCMGHEMCGEIVALGPKVTNPELKVGTKVVVEPIGSCMDKEYLESKDVSKCSSCAQGLYNTCENISFTGLSFADGGFAEFCVVGEDHVLPYPEEIIPTPVAALTEPLAVSWHAVRKSNIQKGESALILGSGPIGLLTIVALKGHGVENITVSEPASARRELAANFNVDVFDPTPYGDDLDKLAKDLCKLSPNGYGFNKVYDCSGVPATFNVMVKALTSNGTGTNIAIWPHNPIDFYPMDLTLKEKKITGSMCYTKLDFEQVLEGYKNKLIDPKEVERLITGIIPLEDGVELGFKELVAHKDKHIKVLLTPNPK